VEPINYESVPSLAARTGLSKSTLYDLIRSGRLSASPVGRRFLVPHGAFEAMLADEDSERACPLPAPID